MAASLVVKLVVLMAKCEAEILVATMVEWSVE